MRSNHDGGGSQFRRAEKVGRLAPCAFRHAVRRNGGMRFAYPPYAPFGVNPMAEVLHRQAQNDATVADLDREVVVTRAGVHWSTLNEAEPVVSGGLTVRIWRRLFVEGHMTKGNVSRDSSWGTAARLTF